MIMARGLLLALLTVSASLPFTIASVAPSASSLARRAGLVPHVNATPISLSTRTGGGSYPRLTNLSDGSILAAYTATDSTTSVKTLTVVRSTDGAQTFDTAPIGTIAQSTGDLNNPFLLQLVNGDVVAAYRNHDSNGTADTFYRITASVSSDGGKTWSFLSEVVQRAATATKNGIWEPFLRLSKKDGSLQVYYASENSADDQDILTQSSTDNGKTWSAPITAAGGTTTGRDGMPGCANFNDGAQKLMCVFETTEGHSDHTFSIKSVVSPDEGATWGERSQVFLPSGSGKNAGAPQIVQMPDGNLVVSFMTDEDTTAAHKWPNGAAFKIVTGPPVATASWGHETQVTAAQSFWPGLFVREDASVLGCVGQQTEDLVCHDITFTTN